MPRPPPIRDGFLTFAYARAVVDAHPQWRAAALADHQMHTEETDGASSIAEMAEAAAAALGRQRIAITDHSKTLRITNGMDEARLAAQGERIAAYNAQGSGPFVLRGIEMDVTPELPERVGVIRARKGANNAGRSTIVMAAGKRERTDPTPGRRGMTDRGD